MTVVISQIALHNCSYGESIPVNMMTFPGGEPHVTITAGMYAQAVTNAPVWIDARIADAEGWMTLMALINAVKALKPKCLGLFLPYFPGARQDRREPGRAFTAKMYAEMLNALSLDLVLTVDPHSEVVCGLVNEFHVIKSSELEWSARSAPYDAVICPDAGAERRATAMADRLKLPILYGHKHRDQLTGKLSGFSCDLIPNEYRRLLMVDDICDGGGTFIGLAEHLRQAGEISCDATEPYRHVLDLFVTHGIFSNGFEALSTRFDMIITTDSFGISFVKLDESKVASEIIPLFKVAQSYMQRRLV